MSEVGWKDFCRFHHRTTPSANKRWDHLTWEERARDTYLVNVAWSLRLFTARPLNRRWRVKLHPVLALSPNRLLVAAGNSITSYKFGYIAKVGQRSAGSATVGFEMSDNPFPTSAPDCDITGLAFLPDGGTDESFLASNISGSLVRLRLRSKDESGRTLTSNRIVRTAHYSLPDGSIKSLSTCGSIALAGLSTGVASIVNTNTPWTQPHNINVGRTCWSTHLELSGLTPYAAIGTESNITVHAFANGSLSEDPLAVLAGPGRAVPAYCMGSYLPGSSPDVIASGWYDGKVRIHDLRCSQRIWETDNFSNEGPDALSAVMTLSDPWRSFDPIYSIASRPVPGETSATGTTASDAPHQYHFIAAGSAMHSVICLWDVRQPRTGWSVYAPGGDSSPVYSLQAEGSRLWGANQWRAFVLDFGPEAEMTVYPNVADVTMENGTCLAPTYPHYSSGL